MVPVPRPSVTLLVVLVVGATLAAVPYAMTADPGGDGLTYEATAFEPASEAHVLAHRSNAVTNLTAAADTNRTRRALDRAAAGEPVTVDANESNLAYLARDTGYAVYRGEYYYVNATEDAGNATRRAGTVTIRLNARSADEAMADLAVPYESASPPVQRVVDRGSAKIEPGDVGNGSLRADVPPVVERDGTHYVLALASVLELFAPFVEQWVRSTLQRVGNVYVGVALGVLAATAVTGRRRALDVRSAAAVAGFAALVHSALVVTSQTPVRPLSVLLAVPTGFVTAAALGVGVSLRSPRSGRQLLAAGSVLVGGLFASALTDAVVSGSVIVLVTAAVWDVVFVLAVGLPLLWLGYVHARSEGDERSTVGPTAE